MPATSSLALNLTITWAAALLVSIDDGENSSDWSTTGVVSAAMAKACNRSTTGRVAGRAYLNRITSWYLASTSDGGARGNLESRPPLKTPSGSGCSPSLLVPLPIQDRLHQPVLGDSA